MKTVLVTTTINVPTVLREYRRLGPDVPFVVVGDTKSPHMKIELLLKELGNSLYLRPDEQLTLYPDLSPTIGWSNIQRRNIAILEAAKMEPDVIVSIDDDNAPMGDFFTEIRRAFTLGYRGTVAQGPWFNIGEFATETFTARGYPYRMLEPYANVRGDDQLRPVGILNGLIFGDPDVTARERIDKDPTVTFYTPQAQRGIALNPSQTWSPVNAQNTAYRAELAPLMMQLPRVGRYDDIFGSYIAQRVLMGTTLHVAFGRPFVKQDRNEHDLEKDLADEEYGSAWTLHFCEFMKALAVPDGTVLERLRAVLTGLEGSEMDLPYDFFGAWLEAFERSEVHA